MCRPPPAPLETSSLNACPKYIRGKPTCVTPNKHIPYAASHTCGQTAVQCGIIRGKRLTSPHLTLPPATTLAMVVILPDLHSRNSDTPILKDKGCWLPSPEMPPTLHFLEEENNYESTVFRETVLVPTSERTLSTSRSDAADPSLPSPTTSAARSSTPVACIAAKACSSCSVVLATYDLRTAHCVLFSKGVSK